MYVNNAYYRIFCLENGVNNTNGSCAGTHKIILINYAIGRNYLKCNLTSLYHTNCNEINKHYSYAQKHEYQK